MTMPRFTPAILSLLAAFASTAASAARSDEPTLAERYMRMRAAGLAGDLDTTTAELNVLLARDPNNDLIAQRAFREAIAAGDRALALKAARLLDAQGKLAPDGPLLFLIDAVDAKDWKRARAMVDRVEADKLFAFMAPMLRAWIALGAGDRDPFAELEPARGGGLAGAYFPGQHALLLLATGKAEAGAAEVKVLPGAGTRIKLAAAAALQRANRPAEAAAMLEGPDAVLAAARTRVAAGEKLPIGYRDASAGLSEVFTQVALDFNRQRLAPVALMLARMATFADPGNSGGWIATGNLLGVAKRRAAALAALSQVKPDDPYAQSAQTLKVALLLDGDDKAAALAEAQALAARPDAGVPEWARVGDVHLSLSQPAEAARAFEKAIAVAGENAPADLVWPLWLQRGAALEQAGDWPAAKAALDKAYALAPEQAVVLNHLGYSLLSRRQDLPQARRLIETASRLRPEDPAITDSLGWARFVSGDAAGAVPLLERASAAEPGEPTINEHLGDVYWTLGRRIEARYAWRAALVTAEARDADRIRTKIDSALTPATAAP